MTEDDLLAGLTDAMTLAGWTWTHSRRSDRALTMGHQGVPDVLAVSPGEPAHVLALELKSDLGVLTAEQMRWLTQLAQASVTVAVVRPVDYDRALRLILALDGTRAGWNWGWWGGAL